MNPRQHQTLTMQQWIKHTILSINYESNEEVKDKDITKIRRLISLVSYFDAKSRS
jgi:hypothetical protein